ncbi:MAG: SDR family NAD(P)-dependent oxidoreductase [Planctomycetota bacterium]
MSVELNGKPIVITGASSGIGRATALACAAAGMPVVLGARRLDRLESVVSDVTATGGIAVAMSCDVGSDEDCRALVEECWERYGSVYAVFANAGYGFEGSVHETPDERVRELFEVNFWGSMRVVRPALERMLGAGEGHILFCSSCLSKIGVPFYSAYCATKAAQDYFGRAMRHELKPRGIAVSTVHPVGTRTEFFDEAEKRSASGAPLAGRTPKSMLQPPDAVARRVVRRIRKGRGGEVWTGLTKPIPFGLSVLLPGVTDLVLGRMIGSRGR